MKCYVITYDLSGGDPEDYEELIEAIKEYRRWAHINLSTWAVVTDYSAKQIRDDLGQYLHEGDRLFVVRSGTEAAWRRVMCRDQWLKDNL